MTNSIPVDWLYCLSLHSGIEFRYNPISGWETLSHGFAVHDQKLLCAEILSHNEMNVFT